MMCTGCYRTGKSEEELRAKGCRCREHENLNAAILAILGTGAFFALMVTLFMR
jgi:hypothetical protein